VALRAATPALPLRAQPINLCRMARKGTKRGKSDDAATTTQAPAPPARGKPSALLDTRVIYCGDNLEQLKTLPDDCVDLIYIDPPFNSNPNYEVLWPKRSVPTASSVAAHSRESPPCVELARVLKKTGSLASPAGRGKNSLAIRNSPR
jgi:hypothetical protein